MHQLFDNLDQKSRQEAEKKNYSYVLEHIEISAFKEYYLNFPFVQTT